MKSPTPFITTVACVFATFIPDPVFADTDFESTCRAELSDFADDELVKTREEELKDCVCYFEYMHEHLDPDVFEAFMNFESPETFSALTDKITLEEFASLMDDLEPKAAKSCGFELDGF